MWRKRKCLVLLGVHGVGEVDELGGTELVGLVVPPGDDRAGPGGSLVDLEVLELAVEDCVLNKQIKSYMSKCKHKLVFKILVSKIFGASLSRHGIVTISDCHHIYVPHACSERFDSMVDHKETDHHTSQGGLTS